MEKWSAAMSSLHHSVTPLLFGKGDARHQRLASLQLDEPEEELTSPFHFPTPLEFAGQNRDDRVGQVEFGTWLEKQLHEGSGVNRLDHIPIKLHRPEYSFLIHLYSARAVVASCQRV